MKFNEKLIELRKKEGLSQEELGYRLNVTRQTISKWELVQGEWGATYEMVNFCKKQNLIPIYSSTKREVEEIKNGEAITKISRFVHRGFIKY